MNETEAYARAVERSYLNSTTGCRVFIGSKAHGGYGSIGTVNGRTVRVHRLAWTVLVGPIPVGMFVCHRCDVPACFAIGHLFLGTHRDNMNDMTSKGRRNGRNARLTPDQVRAIRLDPRNHYSIGNDYGVTNVQVWSIKKRRSWKHLPD